MTDLVTRLREAIDETERIARAAGGSAWIRWTGFGPVVVERETEYGVVYVTGAGVVSDEGQPSPKQVDHILHHDPAAVLRRITADRKILDHIAGELADDPSDDTATYLLETLAEAYGVEA